MTGLTGPRTTGAEGGSPAPAAARGPDLWLRILEVLIVAVAWFALDLLTKGTVARTLVPGQSHRVVGAWLQWTRVENRGAAFSVLWGQDGLLGAIGWLVAAAALAYGPRLDAHWARVSAGLLVAGAAGNGYDRLVHGAVVDFIHVPMFPVFNLADVGVTVGGILVVLALAMSHGAAPGLDP